MMNFLREKISAPPQEFWPVYSWVWNSPITEELIENQIDYMYQNGIRTFYILPCSKSFRNKCLEPDYLSEEYFRLYDYALQYADKRSMHVWVYDEDGWPSGGGNGRVLQKHPELSRKKITWNKEVVRAQTVLSCERDVLAVFEGKTRRLPGYFFEKDTGITIYRTEEDGHYPDLLNPASTDAFLKLVHEAYKQGLKNFKKNCIKMFFTDEPSIGFPYWSETLYEAFYEKYGYDLVDYLPELVAYKEKSTVREHYFDMLSQLFADNYFKPIANWCQNNGLLMTGHLDKDNSIQSSVKSHGQILRLLRCMDVPGVDVIWRQIFPKKRCDFKYSYQNCQYDIEEGENGFFSRFASSAAHQMGKLYAMSESFAAYGNGLTYEQMRYVLHFQVCRGINLINVMNVPSGSEGSLLGGLRPHFIRKRPGAYDLGEWNLYAARLCSIMSLGCPSVTALLYYPVRNYWRDVDEAGREFIKAGRLLEKSGVEFDIADDDLILDTDISTFKNGKICAGYMEYDTIYIPPQSFLDGKVKQRLEWFEEGGGKVIILSDTSDICSERVFQIVEGHGNLMAKKTVVSEHAIYFIYNEGLDHAEGMLSLEENRKVYRLELENCRYTDEFCGNQVPFSLESGEGMLFVTNPGTDWDADNIGMNKELAEELDEFDVKVLRSYEIKNRKITCTEEGRAFYKTKRKSFQELYGISFSGDVLYSTQFQMTDKEPIIIDLGSVEYSCEVYLNGKSLGRRVMRSYCFEGLAEAGENTIEIRVSNTLANQYALSEGMKEFTQSELGNYHELVRPFETESLGGGLKDKVRIFKIK